MNNIEILKNLEKYISFANKQCNFSNDADYKWHKELAGMIENLIKENKELKEEMGKDLDVVYIKGVYDERDKWKNKVKEKIERLNHGERIKFYTEDKKHYYETNSFNEAIKYVLRELLEGE